MAEEVKFLFPVSFDVEEEPEEVPEEKGEEIEETEPEEIVPSFSEEEMAAAREEAFAQGKTEGVSEAGEATEREIIAALASLEGQFEKLFQGHEENQKSILDNAISVAVAISRKVFPTLSERNGQAEIEKMVVTSMASMIDEAEVTVYANPGNAAILEDRLGGLAAGAGYKGEIKVAPSDEISPGDCRVEWSGGGARRDVTEMWQEIDEIVERNLSGMAETVSEDTKETPEAPAEATPEEAVPENAPETPGGEVTVTDPEGP